LSQESIRQALRQAEVDLDGAVARQISIERSIANVNDTEQSTTTIQAGRSQTTTTARSPNKLYQDLTRDLAEVKATIASLKARRSSLGGSLITPTTNNAGVLPAQEAKLNELELTRSSRYAAYGAIRASYDEAILNSAQGADQVSQVDHASVPLYPDKPVRWMFGLLGVVLGVAFGVALAYWVQRRGTRLAPPRAEMPQAIAPPVTAARARGPLQNALFLARAHDHDPRR
jgi:uncharacterized protein involved in exopolysaccharide biosynthesis